MQSQLVAASRTPRQFLITEEHLLRLAKARGWRLRCLEGHAWITVYGQLQDVWLEPGQHYDAPNDGLLLIGALGQCRMKAEPPPRRRWARLLGRLAQRARHCASRLKPMRFKPLSGGT